MTNTEAMERIGRICQRFHAVAIQLRRRHNGRKTLDVGDEHDVQDLLHALLKVDFDDIRREEWTPSLAGSSARVDFFIKTHGILIEVKRTREDLGDRELGKQLLDDISRYREMIGAKALIIFIYDPDGRVINAGGLAGDLEKQDKDIAMKVIICPKQ